MRESLTIGEIDTLLRAATGVALQRLIDELELDPRAGVEELVRKARAREARRIAENRRLGALYRLERELYAQGFVIVAGVDEVGRGAVAGPLTAGACVLPRSPRIVGVNDSKRLTPARRSELAEEIRSVAVCCSVAHVEAAEIDAMGVTAALRLAMTRALDGLGLSADHVVVDGRPVGIHRHETAVVKGDAKVAAIAAASILAKVERDALMVGYASHYPHYGFEINKGYGTLEHFEAISAHGLSLLHRRSFCRDHSMDRLF